MNLLILALLLCGPRALAAFEVALPVPEGDGVKTDEVSSLAGTWVLVDAYLGKRHEKVEPRIVHVSETGDVIRSHGRSSRKWKTFFGETWRFKSDAIPKEMDQVRAAVNYPCVYDLKDDFLTICTSFLEERTRPKDVAIQPGVSTLVYVRGLDKGRELVAQRLAEQLEGKWMVNVFPKDAPHWEAYPRLVIDEGAFVLTDDCKETRRPFSLNPFLEENVGAGPRYVPHPLDSIGKREEPSKAAVPFQIDLTIDDVVYRGVYEDRGPLRFSYFPDKPTERPKSLKAEGAVWVELTRVPEDR